MDAKTELEIPGHAWLLLGGVLLILGTLASALIFQPWSRELGVARAADLDETDFVLSTEALAALTGPADVSTLPIQPARTSLEEGEALVILEQHWGERLPEILAQNRVDAEWIAAYPMTSLAPWSEVSPEVLERALRYLETLREGRAFLSLTGPTGIIDLQSESARVQAHEGWATDFEPLREAAAQVESDLVAQWNRRWDGIEVVIRARWRAGQVEHHPILSCLDEVPEGALYAHSGSARGWTYRIVLLPDEEPALAQSLEEFEQSRRDAFHRLERILVPR